MLARTKNPTNTTLPRMKIKNNLSSFVEHRDDNVSTSRSSEDRANDQNQRPQTSAIAIDPLQIPLLLFLSLSLSLSSHLPYLCEKLTTRHHLAFAFLNHQSTPPSIFLPPPPPPPPSSSGRKSSAQHTAATDIHALNPFPRLLFSLSSINAHFNLNQIAQMIVNTSPFSPPPYIHQFSPNRTESVSGSNGTGLKNILTVRCVAFSAILGVEWSSLTGSDMIDWA